MGESNIAIKKWFSDKERFADFMNGTYFEGEQIIKPENLKQLDGESGIILKDKNGKSKGVQRFRDIMMEWSDSMLFSILAIENQDEIHYAMPVRIMLYDSLSYLSQIEDAWKEHKKKGEKLNAKEFLSHFKKEDKLYPVITVVFYYGSEKWDASLDVHGMLHSEYVTGRFNRMKPYIPNYKINLVDAERLEDVTKFHTDLQFMLGMVQCRNDKELFKQYVKEHKEYFSHLDYNTYEAARILLNSQMKLKEMSVEEYKEEKDMCQALEDIYTEGVETGVEMGEKKINGLILKLAALGRNDDIVRAASDSEYQKKLFEEFGME